MGSNKRISPQKAGALIRRFQLDIIGNEGWKEYTLLPTGAKLQRAKDGQWWLFGYAYDGSDVAV